jgi:hypothetical protein
LQSRFKQIVGFHFVSSLNMTGIAELAQHIIQVTLQQKYIGEKIPEAWFNFEKKIKKMAEKVPLVAYDEVVEIAESASLFDSNEILQAIRFLNDLGSLQYFEINGLKDKVVINPQWIGEQSLYFFSDSLTDVYATILKKSKNFVKFFKSLIQCQYLRTFLSNII